MPANWVHQTLSLIAFGFPYADVHRRKDSYAAKAPGLRHRQVGHRIYQRYGTGWTFETLSSDISSAAVIRIARWKGGSLAERYQVSVAHDVDDRVWDYDNIPLSERPFRRKCLEVWCAWLVLNPYALKVFADVDVLGGRIHRLIDGVDVWEEEPGLPDAFARLVADVQRVCRYDRRLREGLQVCDPMFREALSNRPLPTSGARAVT